MRRPNKNRLGIALKRFAILFAIAAFATSALAGVGYWVYTRTSSETHWKSGLVCLIGAEILYCATAAVTLLAAIVMIAVLYARRPVGALRRRLFRGLLLCGAMTVAFLMAEGACALRLWMSHSRTAMPVGGLRAAARQTELERWLPNSVDVRAPAIFPDSDDTEQIDIAVIGESSAEGVPYNRWTSVGHMLQWQLGNVFPTRKTGLQVLAHAAQTLEGQEPYLANLKRRPEILIIYCGHNELISRFDAGREPAYYLDDQLPSWLAVLVERIEALSAVCSLIAETADKCRVAIPPPRFGHRALVDVPAFTPNEYKIILEDFRRRLEAIVLYAKRIGSLPVLISPPGNDGAYEPNRSVLPASMPRSQRESFAEEFLAARGLEATDAEAARAAYERLIARQAGFAEAHYRYAQLLQKSGAWDEAYRHYKIARDVDGFPMRTLTEFQNVYREIAQQHGCALVHGQSFFHAVGDHGLLNDHLFHDAMHPSFRGQIALAQAVLHELRAAKALGWPAGTAAPLIDPAECARHFNIKADAWAYICQFAIMFYDMTYRVRYDQSHRLAMKDAFGQAYNKIHAGAAPESVGLPNVGLPPPVPEATSSQIRGDEG